MWGERQSGRGQSRLVVCSRYARADGRAEQWSPLNTGEMIAIVLALEAAKTTTRRIWRRSGTSSGLPPKSRLIFTKEETVERER